jgi:hypothetical protein
VRAELERPDEPAAEAPATSAAPAVTTTADGSPAVAAVSGTANPPSPASPPAPPIEVFSFGGKILARATGRMMRRPLFWVVVAAAAVLIYRLFH